MTIQEAETLGYKVIAASAFEVGLIKNGRGIRTWFYQDFDKTLPPLDHPAIQRAIQITEELERGQNAMTSSEKRSALPCEQPCPKCGSRNPKRNWCFRGAEMMHPVGHPETTAMLAKGKIREVIYNECLCGWSWETPVLVGVSETGPWH